MTWVILALLVVVVTPFLVRWWRFVLEVRAQAWEGFAREFGLRHRDDLYEGHVGASTVVVKTVRRGLGRERKTYTQIRILGDLPAGLTLRRQTALKRLGGRDATIGEPAFDEAVYIQGGPVALLIALDSATRTFLREAIVNGWTLEHGELVGEVCGDPPLTIADDLRDGLRMAERLRAAHRGTGDRLVMRVTDDPVASVRHDALAALASGSYGQGRLRDAANVALADPAPGNRFLAADLARDLPTLLSLADAGHPASLVRVARESAWAPEARQVVEHWITRRLADTHASRCALAEALGLLGPVGVPGAESVLLGYVKEGTSAERLAALAALERCGAVTAVPTLLPLRDGRFGGEVQRASEAAVLAIQGRARGAEAGALAIVTSEAGGLAFAGEQRGAAVAHTESEEAD